MSRIDDLIAELCPDGVEFKALGEVGSFIRGTGMQKSQLSPEGVPAIHYGEIHTHYGVWTERTKSFIPENLATKLRRARHGDLIIATTSEDDASVAKATTWLGADEVAVSGDAYIFRHTLDPRYMAYFFQSSSFQDQKKRHITGTKVRRVSGDSLARVVIAVPPLEVQQEIVRVLDKFTQLEAELEAELEARRQQYEHYRDRLLSLDPSNSSWSTLEQVSLSVTSGATPKAGSEKYYKDGNIPWLRTGEVSFNEIWDTEMKITEVAVCETGVSWVDENSIIVAISGATAGRSAVNKIRLTTNQHCCNLKIDESCADYRYVFHWVGSQFQKLKSLGRGARSDLNVKIIKEFPIPLLPLEEQRRIASILDKFDALVNDLTVGLPAEIAARRKQYEYYRDRLLTFEEKR